LDSSEPVGLTDRDHLLRRQWDLPVVDHRPDG
jgi:hypothetical protein